MSDQEPRCPSCGVPWIEHSGASLLCLKLRYTEAALRECLEATCTTLEHVPAKYKILATWIRENKAT